MVQSNVSVKLQIEYKRTNPAPLPTFRKISRLKTLITSNKPLKLPLGLTEYVRYVSNHFSDKDIKEIVILENSVLTILNGKLIIDSFIKDLKKIHYKIRNLFGTFFRF